MGVFEEDARNDRYILVLFGSDFEGVFFQSNVGCYQLYYMLEADIKNEIPG